MKRNINHKIYGDEENNDIPNMYLPNNYCASTRVDGNATTFDGSKKE